MVIYVFNRKKIPILEEKLKIKNKVGRKSSKNLCLKECVSIIFALTKQARTKLKKKENVRKS